MELYLIILGVIALGLGLLMEHPAFRQRITRPWVEQHWLREETRVQQTRQQVEKAREDVVMLLEELDRASDKVVELMTNWADKAHKQTLQVPLIHARANLTQIPETQAKGPQSPEAAAPRDAGRSVPIESAKGHRLETTGTVPEKGKPVLKDKYKTVLHMAEQGLSIDDIAKSAKIGKGEVQLLLELQNRGDKG